MVREWESLNAKAELARMHRDGHCHETMVWYRPLEDVVACSPTLGESYRRAITQGPIIERGFTRISRAGIPKRTRPKLPPKMYSQTSVDCVSTKRGWGPKTPLCEGKGPENPGVVAPSCCCGLSRKPQARSGQTVEEVRPTSLPSSSTVVTVRAGLHFNDWCLVVTVQTTVEVPQLLGVPVEIPQVQFLDKFDTPVTHASVVCSSTRWSMSLLCCAMGVLQVQSVSLSVDLVVVCCLQYVLPSGPCRRAVKVSRSRSSCPSLTSSCPQ